MTAYYDDGTVKLLLGEPLEVLTGMDAGSVDCIVTSPPYYGLRDYGTPGQYGGEATPTEYVERLRSLFTEARRVLAGDGTLWLNLGDSYAYPPGSTHKQGQTGQRRNCTFTAETIRGTTALPTKNLIGIPWRVAFALQDDGWILRNEIIWNKPNAMPESVTDRLSNRHEHLFMFSKSPRYWFDLDAIRAPHTGAPGRTWEERKQRGEPGRYGKAGQAATGTGWFAANEKGRNPGDVWTLATRPYPQAHFAVFPIDLPLRCIKAGCKPGGGVLDPFSGAGTTGAAARQLGRKYVGVDNKAAYHDLAIPRFAQGVLTFEEGSAA